MYNEKGKKHYPPSNEVYAWIENAWHRQAEFSIKRITEEDVICGVFLQEPALRINTTISQAPCLYRRLRTTPKDLATATMTRSH